MQQVELLSLEQVEEFLKGAEGIEFRAEGRTQRYALFEALLEQISPRRECLLFFVIVQISQI